MRGPETSLSSLAVLFQSYRRQILEESRHLTLKLTLSASIFSQTTQKPRQRRTQISYLAYSKKIQKYSAQAYNCSHYTWRLPTCYIGSYSTTVSVQVWAPLQAAAHENFFSCSKVSRTGRIHLKSVDMASHVTEKAFLQNKKHWRTSNSAQCSAHITCWYGCDVAKSLSLLQ